MATVTTKPLTADEFFKLPEPRNGAKRELVRGEVIEMPPTGLQHGRIQTNIAALIWLFLRTNKLGTVYTESGVATERDDEGDSVRGPDVSYYTKERLPLDRIVVKYHDLAPDLCVEVVSPSNTRKELREKIKEYFAAGVRMVWIVDPDDRSITVLTQPGQGQAIYEPGELSGGEVLPGFTCRVSELFE